MPTVKIWTSGDERPNKYEVSTEQARDCVAALTDPNAVLEFPRPRAVAYVPVRQIIYLVVEE